MTPGWRHGAVTDALQSDKDAITNIKAIDALLQPMLLYLCPVLQDTESIFVRT